MSIIHLERASFRPLADGVKKGLFRNPVSLSIQGQERWAITGPRKLDLLHVLASKHIAEPPLSRRYPFLSQDFWPSQVTQLVEFGSSNIKASHLSARYESFRDEFDITLNDYLLQADNNQEHVDRVLEQFMLKGIEDRWVVGLSNGQNRRARLAYSILKHPRMLFVDEPFLGLDPPSRETVSTVLETLPPKPHVVLGLRLQDHFPSWITHVAIADESGIVSQGTMPEVEPELERLREEHMAIVQKTKDLNKQKEIGESIIELRDVSVSYKGETIFSNLSFTARRGEKWHLQGPNGSGKSTLLSLLTADHPQSWNSKVVLFGEPRKTGRQSYFSINEQIGHCSPEIHALFPTRRNAFEAISTGFVVGSFIPPTNLTEEQKQTINNYIDEFELDRGTPFGDMSLSDQKTIMLLRAIVKSPKILIMDEALSGMDDLRIEKCKRMIQDYDGTTIVVGHIENEVPACDKYIRFTQGGVVEVGSK
ncbi:hypothetical protein TRVA0_023S01662 [Trichomonascus vanleenenianus]|uniref:uncharacterized protein n=1 Tax=Trichomonascus vanleenenianus TaxID=2268995 RepID=UPI003ECB9BCE